MSDRFTKVTANEALTLTKRLYIKYFPQILIANLLSVMISLSNDIFNAHHDSPFVGMIISIILSTIITCVFLWYLDKKENGRRLSFQESFRESAPRFFPVLVVDVIVTLITFLGFFLFIIPGLIWMTMFSMAEFFVLFQNKGLKQSLDASKALTKGNRRQIFKAIASFYMPLLILGMVATFMFHRDSLAIQMYSVLVTIFLGSVPQLITYAFWTRLRESQQSA